MPLDAAKNCDGEVYNRRTKASMVFRLRAAFRSIVVASLEGKKLRGDELSNEGAVNKHREGPVIRRTG